MNGPKKIICRALMSAPRIGWNDSWTCIIPALGHFGIPLEVAGGVFWGQSMQRTMEKLEDGADWLLTIDYDSMFSARHLGDLLQTLAVLPQADALAAMQMRRNQESPLVTEDGKTEAMITGDPMPVSSAHFGLTLFRVSALRKTPKPWFKGEPDAQGGWGPGRLDADMWFWKQWREAGNTIYLAPRVRIGHLEVMVSEFDDNYDPQHRYVPDWRKANGL